MPGAGQRLQRVIDHEVSQAECTGLILQPEHFGIETALVQQFIVLHAGADAPELHRGVVLALIDLPETRVPAGRHRDIGITQLPHAEPRPSRHLFARSRRRAQRDHQVQLQRGDLVLRVGRRRIRLQQQDGDLSRRQAVAQIVASQHVALLGGEQPGFQARQRAEQGPHAQARRPFVDRPTHHQQSSNIEILAVPEPLDHLVHPAGLLIPINQQSHSVGLHFSCSCVGASSDSLPVRRTG
ncbi:hypothetical protein D9M68_623160 [compost metagenome]